MGLKNIASLVLLTVAVGCSGSSSVGFDVCAAVDDDLVESVIGAANAEGFTIDRYVECRWETIDGRQAVTAGVETATNPALYLEHSIEGTTSGPVTRLDIGEEAVLFEDEALMARMGSYVVIVTAEEVDLDLLLPLLSAVITRLPVATTAG
jgi:hypothetical protein